MCASTLHAMQAASPCCAVLCMCVCASTLHGMQAASERPSHQQTAPAPEQLIASWSKFVGEFRGHVKQ